MMPSGFASFSRVLVPFLGACLIAPSISPAQEESVSMDLLLERCRTLILREGEGARGDRRDALDLAAALSENGSWPDIDYEDRDPAGWPASRHLHRTRALALAAALDRNEAQESAGLRRAALASLDHWLDHQYRSSNWWWNEIGVPRAMRDIVLLLGDDLTGERRAGAIEVIGRHKLRGNGANLMWSAELSLHHGCLIRNPGQVANAADRIWKETVVGAPQGIQPDWSFFQHGARLQMFHYGRGYLEVVCKAGWQTRQTPWEMPDSRRDIITRFILDGMQWMCRGNHTVPGTIDRAVSRTGALRLDGLDGLVRLWQEVDLRRDGGMGEDLETFRNRLGGTGAPLTGFRHFPLADFTAYHRPSGSVFLKTLSNRTLPTESINNENLKGGPYLHCGDHYAIRDGGEYGDLQPLWLWEQLPGLARVDASLRQDRQAFVGGMGDGASGLTAMDFVRKWEGKALAVRKLWAFHEDAVLCLMGGWEITEPVGDIVTSVEQCRLRGPIETGAAAESERGQPGERGPTGATARPGAEERSGETGPLGQARWVHHGGFGYLALGEAMLEVRRRRAKGSWHEINRRYDPQEITEEVLHVDLRHGSDPGPAGFAVVIGADRERLERLAASPDWRVLRNDRQCQCLRFENGLHMGAFHGPAGTGAGEGLQVDAPCLAMWSEEHLWLCDPTHRGAEITVTWRNRARTVVLPPGAGIVRIDPSEGR